MLFIVYKSPRNSRGFFVYSNNLLKTENYVFLRYFRIEKNCFYAKIDTSFFYPKRVLNVVLSFQKTTSKWQQQAQKKHS